MSPLEERSSFTRVNVASAAKVAPIALDSANVHNKPTAVTFEQVTDNRILEANLRKVQPFYIAAKYEGTTINTPARSNITQLGLRKQEISLKQDSSQLVTEMIDFDGVSVLALVCERLPRLPDPDISLQW